MEEMTAAELIAMVIALQSEMKEMRAAYDLRIVKNMGKMWSLAKSISRTGWGQFREFLTYKADRYGRTLAVVDRWYPSSKTCSVCGHLLASLSLGTRHWSCPNCGTRHDRDLNAAKNIKTAGGLPVDACGGDVRTAIPPGSRPC